MTKQPKAGAFKHAFFVWSLLICAVKKLEHPGEP